MKTKIKYDISTILIVSVTLTLLAIFGLIFASYNSTLGQELRQAGSEMDINQTYVNETTQFMAVDLPQYTDNYIFWFFIAVFIGLIITALYLDFEPSIMIIIFIFGAIGVLGAWMGSEVYGEFSADESLTATATDMTKTQLLMSNPYFPVFIFVGLIVMIVVMYTKKRQGEWQ